MTPFRGRNRRGLLLLGLVACLALARPAPAPAIWTAGGAGVGSGSAATMPAGTLPTVSVSGTAVTVTWAQSTFLGSALGGYVGGGYTVRRYALGSSTPIVPAAGCAGTVTGGGALQCTETGLPVGSWQYAVTPLLGASFTGAEGAKSAVAAVLPAAPVLSAVTAQNPASGQAGGALKVDWAPVAGATGYNVYRRTAAGSYDPAQPVNGATPVTGTSLTDAAAGLTPGGSYAYVVRTVASSPALESAASNEISATTIARPAAPAGTSATAVAAGAIDVGWSAVAGVAGYNVYRRAGAAAYDFSTPLNGATPQAAVTRHDTTTVDGTTYHYAVRAVITGAGGAQVESLDGTESAAVTADATPPTAPVSVTVTAGGPVWATATCGVAAGTRYLNAAGIGAVGVRTTIAAPEAGESVVLSAVSGATSASATVAAGATTVDAVMALGGLTAGTVTLTARTADAAGNQSAAVSPTAVVVKDVAAPSLTASYSGGLLGLNPTLSGTSECGATIVATKTAGGNTGAQWTTTTGTGTSWSVAVEGPLLGLGSVTYSVTATDRAGNTSAPVSASG
jgi:hypothetical protein